MGIVALSVGAGIFAVLVGLFKDKIRPALLFHEAEIAIVDYRKFCRANGAAVEDICLHGKVLRCVSGPLSRDIFGGINQISPRFRQIC